MLAKIGLWAGWGGGRGIGGAGGCKGNEGKIWIGTEGLKV